jgi:hypothetical protein
MSILKTKLFQIKVLLEFFKLFALAALVVLVSTMSVSHAIAAEITYEPNGVEVRNNPTVCSIQPIDSDLSKNELDKFSTQTRASIDEWEQQLKSETGKSNWSNWEINHKHLTYDKLNSDSIIGCDIVVMFSKTPPNLGFWGILGLALSDYETGKTLIEIYYSIPELCDSGERERQGDTIYIFQVPCYGDMMLSDHLGGVIRHEMGHGFGLGHYMSSDEEVTLDWNKGLSPTPSIMVETSYDNSDELRIAPKDIEKLMDIYGEDGFLLNSEEEQNLTLVNPHLNEQNYVDFKNNDYGFTFEYPEKWGVDDTVEVFEDFTSVLYLTDDEEVLDREIEVGFYSNPLSTSSYDDDIFDALIENEKKYCEDFLAEDYGFDCENLILFESTTDKGKNSKVYTIKSIWNDGASHQLIHRNYVISGDKFWEISGYGGLAAFLLTSDVMEHSINSFTLDKIAAPNNPPITSEPEGQSQIDPPSLQLETGPAETTQIPDWVRGNAEWWAQGAIGDSDFVSGIQYLIKEEIMTIPETAKSQGKGDSQEIPSWIKNNADWWAQGLITDGDFVKGIQYLVEQGIIEV